MVIIHSRRSSLGSLTDRDSGRDRVGFNQDYFIKNMLFNKQKPVTNVQAERDYEHEITKLQHEHRLKVAEIENAHKLAMKEKEFGLKHFKDEEIQKLRESVANKDTEIEVLKKENEMLAKITNLNADLIDIKDLVSKLIGKLPEINLSSLTINGSNK